MTLCVAVCCSVLQCVAVFWKQSRTLGIQLHDPVSCRAFQYIEVCCSVLEAKSYPRLCVLQCVAVYCSVLQHEKQDRTIRAIGTQLHDLVCCSVLQYIAVYCSALQRVQAQSYTGRSIAPLLVLQGVAVYCCVLQC